MSLRIGNRNQTPRLDLGTVNRQQQFLGRWAELSAVKARAGLGTDRMTDSDAKVKSEIQSLFKEQFGKLANDKDAFHNMMKKVFGNGYDKAKAETYRQQAAAGDFSWLPKIEFVDSATLNGANGAYNSEEDVVYINSDLKNNVALAAQTYVEEAGHGMDKRLNKTDTRGDEGEMFRRLLGGEKLSKAQIAEIRNENDKGVITVNGKQVEVEFWNPFKAIAKAFKKVGKAIVGAVKEVGKAIGKAVTGIAKGVATVAKGVFNGVKMFVTGIGEGIGGFFSNVVRGKFGEAFKSLVRGADKAFLQAPARIVNGLIDGAEQAVKGVTHLLGPLGKPLRNIVGRGFDIGRTIFNTGVGIVRDVYRMATEVPIGFVSDLGKSVSLLFQGKFKEAAEQFGMAFVNAPARVLGGVVDILARALQGTADVVGVGLGLQPPSRPLSSEEKELLQQIYGDSIDVDSIRIQRGGITEAFGMAPHTVGNTLYMRETWNGQDIFNDDGSLTDAGKELLVHESAHAWQNQNGGGDYIHKALWAQAMAAIGSGDRSGAYDWRAGANAGVPWEGLNPEQQAELIEGIGAALMDDGVVEASDWNPPLSDTELAYAMSAWSQVRAGQGAP